ncbi:unnamed protein product [Microthlaspi erraticum]|uniref:Uncharacterized protein n=1 Tax=Microthlaspi erraticum TaxID=1685480 RepID=A0A6D2IWX7_9BRAS|nr:unnamed protein product [Microthlaspi erraticum]
MLDTASNGNFLNQDVDDGWQLVENSLSNGSYGEEYDRTNWSSTTTRSSPGRSDAKRLALNSKLDKLILAQFPAKHVNYVSEQTASQGQEGEETTHRSIQHKETSMVLNRTWDTEYYTDPPRAPQVFHKASTNGLIPNTNQDWDMKDMLQQLLTRASQRFTGNEQQVVDKLKLESLTSRVQIIESSSASSSSPQEYAQAVTLRSGDNSQAG